MDEQTLIARGKAGDTRAFVQLTRRYQNLLFQYLGRMGLAQAEVEELAQDTWLRVFRHLARYDADQAGFTTWLLTIARRLALNASAKAYRQHEVREDEGMAEVAEADALLPFEQLASARRRLLLREAVRQLPPDQRSVLAMAYTRELSLEEIAQIEDCALGTVKSRLFRAKARLRALLADHVEDLI